MLRLHGVQYHCNFSPQKKYSLFQVEVTNANGKNVAVKQMGLKHITSMHK